MRGLGIIVAGTDAARYRTALTLAAARIQIRVGPNTTLVGDFRDPAQLDDLLGRIADCGLEVARVEEVFGSQQVRRP